jgi:hypothetical protein
MSLLAVESKMKSSKPVGCGDCRAMEELGYSRSEEMILVMTAAAQSGGRTIKRRVQYVMFKITCRACRSENERERERVRQRERERQRE